MKKHPKVSIILLTYNQANYLKDCIESVFSQSYKDWELIISDNGSSDGTKDILKEYISDPRVKVLAYESNEFVTLRSNQAFKESRGEFISILYGDDYYLPNKLEDQLNIFSNLSEEWGVVHGPGFSLNQDTKVQTLETSLEVHGEALIEILKNYYSKGFINPISPLARRECFERYPFYNDLFTEGESIYIKFSLAYKFFYSSTPLVVMRVHEKNARWFSKKNLEIQDQCLERLSHIQDFPDNGTKALFRLRALNYSIGSWENIRLSDSMDKEYVRKRIYKAIKLDFKQIFNLRNYLSLIISTFPELGRKFFNLILDKLSGKSRSLYFDESFINKD